VTLQKLVKIGRESRLTAMTTESARTKNEQNKLVAREKLIYNLTEDLLVLLEDRGMTKAELAKALGKSRSYVTQVLSGSRNMTLGTLSDICHELNAKPIVRVLPNGSKVLTYEQNPIWLKEEIQNIKSSNDISYYENKEPIEYRPVLKVVGY